MNVPPAPSDKRDSQVRRVARGAARLTVREYLPMAAMLAFWAVVALGIGHADTARLLAATVMLRGVMMLSELSTSGPMRARTDADPDVRRRSLRNALLMQGGALLLSLASLFALTAGLSAFGHGTMALLLWGAAVGLPARALRMANPRAFPRRQRLYLTIPALAAAGLVWAIGGGPLAMALAYGAREWLATGIGALVGDPQPPQRTINERLRFAEVAKSTVVSSRRLLTYRLTKNILTVFGPFGNIAARTGRGFNLHGRLEKYIPHKRSGFILFALLTGGAAIVVPMRSGEPVALVLSAGLAQLCAIAVNVLLLWRYLPVRDDPTVIVEEDDDD